MHRHGNLWPELVGFRNLLTAARNAARGKRRSANVARFGFDLEHQLIRLHDELVSHTYQPGAYRTFEIFEPKRRLISAAPFRDRVVHHALCNVLEPIFERTFVFDSYACRKGKGTHAAVDRFQHFARQHRYVLKCDLRKFFPSVDHEILKQVIARKIKDRDVLGLVHRIIDSSNEQEPVEGWFPGDDLDESAASGDVARTPRPCVGIRARTRRPCYGAELRSGIPIGNQTSQFFANVLLNPFDHFVTEQLGHSAYVRYVDDFAIFGDDKGHLSDVRDRCREHLAIHRLRLHPEKSAISRTIDGVPFLGFRVFPTHRLLPRQNLIRLRRRLRAMQAGFANGEVTLASIRQRLVSWLGHARHANTTRLRADVFDSTIFSRTTVEQ